ncbi:hypothetical protein EIP86_001436 [Pleurotus ostreatoroseus]|nr:hypothetical protein EIP86_001436 [Pleurotus ostreatoroseus]
MLDTILANVQDPDLLKYKMALNSDAQSVEAALAVRPASDTQLNSQSEADSETPSATLSETAVVIRSKSGKRSKAQPRPDSRGQTKPGVSSAATFQGVKESSRTKRKRKEDDDYVLPALGGVKGVGSVLASTNDTILARYTHVEFPETSAVDDDRLDANAPAKKIRPRTTSVKGKERATSVVDSSSPSTSEGKEIAGDRYTPISESSESSLGGLSAALSYDSDGSLPYDADEDSEMLSGSDKSVSAELTPRATSVSLDISTPILAGTSTLPSNALMEIDSTPRSRPCPLSVETATQADSHNPSGTGRTTIVVDFAVPIIARSQDETGADYALCDPAATSSHENTMLVDENPQQDRSGRSGTDEHMMADDDLSDSSAVSQLLEMSRPDEIVSQTDMTNVQMSGATNALGIDLGSSTHAEEPYSQALPPASQVKDYPMVYDVVDEQEVSTMLDTFEDARHTQTSENLSGRAGVRSPYQDDDIEMNRTSATIVPIQSEQPVVGTRPISPTDIHMNPDENSHPATLSQTRTSATIEPIQSEQPVVGTRPISPTDIHMNPDENSHPATLSQTRTSATIEPIQSEQPVVGTRPISPTDIHMNPDENSHPATLDQPPTTVQVQDPFILLAAT